MVQTIVVSGVNLVEMGPLAVFRDALESLVHFCEGRYHIIALVQRAELLAVDGVHYLEFPSIKESWLRRLRFEYFSSFELSKKLEPVLWIAMDNVTPRVYAPRQVVYCHNPTPFYRFRFSEAWLDPKFGVFVLLFRFLYRLFLQRNSAVIVQQEWIRAAFRERFGARNVIVATPSVEVPAALPGEDRGAEKRLYRFFYPALSRTFKNHELILGAVRLLEERSVEGFELFLTVNEKSNRCGAGLVKRFGALRSVRWLGSIPRTRVYELYGQTDCLIFPSKLETWGLPITEFKSTGKPILLVDLPYAHETIGTYDQVAFFGADDVERVAAQMESAVLGKLMLCSVNQVPIGEPHAKDWPSLWGMLIPT